MAEANPTGRLILVVDDDPMVLRLVSSTLAHNGFRVMVAEDGAGGLETFLAHANEIDLVLTDVVMPIMDGIRMVQEIRKVRPEARIILMTAYSDAVVATMTPGKFALVRKPFLSDELIRAVNANLYPPTAEA